MKSDPRSDKTMKISFDEWNVWYVDRYQNVERDHGGGRVAVAPRLLEDVYSVADAVVFGNLMISLLKHADRVSSASLAQLVNVIAPIMTEPGGAAWKQTMFFPFALTARLAQGEALRAGARGAGLRDRRVRRGAARRRGRHERPGDRARPPSSSSTGPSTRRSP